MNTPIAVQIALRLLTCCTLLVGAAMAPAAAIPGTAVLPDAPVLTASGSAEQRCGQVLIIGVRGSGQTATDFGGWGREMASLRSEIVERAYGLVVDERAIDYPAAPVEQMTPTRNQMLGLVAGGVYSAVAISRWADTRLGAYMDSIAKGVRRVRDAVETASRRCRDRKIVLSGYSQGAMVVHRALVGMARDGQDGLIKRIAAVGLLADGDRTPNSGQRNVGTAAAGARGVSVLGGLAGTDIPRSVARRTFSFCSDNDVVCDATLGNLVKFDRGSKIHTTYSNSQLARLAGLVSEHLPRIPAVGDETGRVDFIHPAWGPATLITSINSNTMVGFIRVVDADGRTRWFSESGGTGEGPWYEMRLHNPSIDATGQIFIDWNPGRYNGVTILQPVPDGFQDHNTLSEVFYNVRFYYADVVDVEGDGLFEIAKHYNDCNPDCAGGTITTEIFRWNGTDYVAD